MATKTAKQPDAPGFLTGWCHVNVGEFMHYFTKDHSVPLCSRAVTPTSEFVPNKSGPGGYVAAASRPLCPNCKGLHLTMWLNRGKK